MLRSLYEEPNGKMNVHEARAQRRASSCVYESVENGVQSLYTALLHFVPPRWWLLHVPPVSFRAKWKAGTTSDELWERVRSETAGSLVTDRAIHQKLDVPLPASLSLG